MAVSSGVVVNQKLYERHRHGEREPITAVWGQSPHRGPVTEPLVRGTKPPWSWKAFSFWTSNGSGKFASFSSLYAANSV